jgi:hypothetical protein
MIQIGVHPTGEEPDQHIIRIASRVLCTTTICEVPTKLNLGPTPEMKSWPPAMVRPGRHPGLPHSPSNKPPQSRDVRFDKVVTKLQGLPGPINPTCG